MARPLKKFPRKRILKEIARLRGSNNREWAIVWEHGLQTARGRRAWRKIRETDMKVSKWMGRI